MEHDLMWKLVKLEILGEIKIEVVPTVARTPERFVLVRIAYTSIYDGLTHVPLGTSGESIEDCINTLFGKVNSLPRHKCVVVREPHSPTRYFRYEPKFENWVAITEFGKRERIDA